MLFLRLTNMSALKKSSKDFIQDPTYAVHFDEYLGLLSKLLHHDPEMFKLKKTAKIVDVGCGYGNLLKELRDRGYKKLIGIEPDKLCRNGCLKEKLDVRDGTIANTKLPNASADAVIVNMVFHHIKNYTGAAAEIHRILKPGGLLCFMEPSPTPLRKLMDILTFKTPLPKYLNFVNTRYKVMRLEMKTGLYPNFLSHQKEFLDAINENFSPLWHRKSWFFQFGKYRKRK